MLLQFQPRNRRPNACPRRPGRVSQILPVLFPEIMREVLSAALLELLSERQGLQGHLLPRPRSGSPDSSRERRWMHTQQAAWGVNQSLDQTGSPRAGCPVGAQSWKPSRAACPRQTRPWLSNQTGARRITEQSELLLPPFSLIFSREAQADSKWPVSLPVTSPNPHEPMTKQALPFPTHKPQMLSKSVGSRRGGTGKIERESHQPVPLGVGRRQKYG